MWTDCENVNQYQGNYQKRALSYFNADEIDKSKVLDVPLGVGGIACQKKKSNLSHNRLFKQITCQTSKVGNMRVSAIGCII